MNDQSSSDYDYDSDESMLTLLPLDMLDNEEDYEKELNEKNEIIKKLQQEIEKLKCNQPIDNTDNINKLIKLIKIIYGFAEMVYYSDEIFIYGSLFEKIFQKKSLDNSKLYFLFPTLNEFHFNKFTESLHDMDCVLNEDYNIKKRSFVSINNQLIIINLWDLKIQLNDNLIINITLHDNNYIENIMFDCQNIVLTRSGLTIKKITEMDYKNNRRMPSLSLLQNINNILNYQVNLSMIPNINSQLKIFETIEKQNDLIKEGYKINNGFLVNDDEDETCAICYRKHIEDNEVFLYRLKCTHTFCSGCLYKSVSSNLNHSENCPLCRQHLEIELNL